MPIEIKKYKNSPYYYLRGTYRGVHVFRSTKTRDKKIADEDRKAVEDEINASGKIGKSHTFRDAVDAWLNAGGAERFLVEMDDNGKWKPGPMREFENMPVGRIDQVAMDAAAQRTYPSSTHKPQTLNRQFYAPAIAVLNHASRLGWCEKREWMRPRVKRSDIERTKWFSYEDAAKFYAHAPDHLKAIFVFCIYTGARITEAIELEIKDINLESRWAVLNATKTDNLRGVPLHTALVRVLSEGNAARKRRQGEGNAVLATVSAAFLTQRDTVYASKRENGLVQGGGYFKTAWKATIRRAGLTGYTPYSARHTFNNWLIMAGIDQATREALMGHDNGSTNAIYSDVPQTELIAAVDKLKDFTVHGNSTSVRENS